MSFENAFFNALPPSKQTCIFFFIEKSLKLRNIALESGFCGSYWISESGSLLGFG